MSQEQWPEMHATIMTTHPLQAYGGICMAREVLVSARDQINDRGLPMHTEHDLSRPLRVRNQRAFISDVEEDGGEISYLRMAFEIHPDDAEAASHLRSMSVGFTEPLDPSDSSGAEILAGNAAWFDDDALKAARAYLEDTPVVVCRSYQFSFIPDPQLLLVLGVAAFQFLWSSGVIGGALWDGLKGLMKGRNTPTGASEGSETVISVKVSDGVREHLSQVKTNDADVAKAALDRLAPSVEAFFANADQTALDQPLTREIQVWNVSEQRWDIAT